MAFDLEGTIDVIYDQVQVNEKFKKREFILDTGEEYNGQYWANPIRFQCVNDRCSILDAVKVGQRVRVTFAHKGSKYEKDGKVNYITNLNCWQIESLTPGPSPKERGGVTPAPFTYSQQKDNFNVQAGGGGSYQPSPEQIDDLPF